MHLADGVVSLPVIAGGFAVAAGLVGWASRHVRDDEIPKIAVMTAAFFAASLIHFKMPGTSVHLTLHGLLAVVLGRRALLAIPVGLFLQAALLGHGGMTVLGVNTCLFGFPALLCGWLYQLLGTRWERARPWWGGVCGGLAVILSGALLMLALMASRGEDFRLLAQFALLAHIPIMLIEGIVTGFTVAFLARVQPELICRSEDRPAS